MTAHRRVIEDRAYGAEDDLAELEGIKAVLMLAVSRMDRLIKRLDGDLCGNVEDAASMAILFSCGMNFVQGNFLQEPEQVMTYDFGGS